MSNVKTLSLSLAALSIAAAFAMPAQAAGESGKIELQGRVAENCTVAVTQLPKATALDILAGEKDAQVANVVESCNIGAGYKVSLTSANAGKLLNPLTGAQPVGFDVAYDNATGAIEKENRGLAGCPRGAAAGATPGAGPGEAEVSAPPGDSNRISRPGRPTAAASPASRSACRDSIQSAKTLEGTRDGEDGTFRAGIEPELARRPEPGLQLFRIELTLDSFEDGIPGLGHCAKPVFRRFSTAVEGWRITRVREYMRASDSRPSRFERPRRSERRNGLPLDFRSPRT